MLQFPTTPVYRTGEFSIEHPAIVNKTTSGRTQASPDGPARMKVQITYNSGVHYLSDDELRPVWAFINRCQGQLRPFEIYLHHLSDGHGPSVTGAAAATSAGAYSVQTTGWPTETTIRKAGDFIQFGAGGRAYLLAADLISNGSGAAVAQLATPLISSVAAATAAIVQGILFRMRLDSATAQITQEPGRIQKLRTIGMEEDINA